MRGRRRCAQLLRNSPGLGFDGLGNENRRFDATPLILKAHPEACILIVTQHGDPGLRNSAIEAGARGVVLKDDLLALSYFWKSVQG